MISYEIGDSSQELIFSDAVLGHFNRHRQRTPQSREAGGQLFARFDGNRIWIERATGPRSSDRRSAFAFIPDRLAERREIGCLFKLGLHFVGDWHTHPEPYPKPSRIDIESFNDMFSKSHHKLGSFVMVIVGTAPAPDGLFVGLCGDKLVALTAKIPL